MQDSKNFRPPLIVDPDGEFLKTVSTPTNDLKFVFLKADSGKDAQLIIADHELQISAVFINLDVKNPPGVSVIRAVHQHRPGTPVYVIYNTTLPYDEKDLKLLGVQKAIQK